MMVWDYRKTNYKMGFYMSEEDLDSKEVKEVKEGDKPFDINKIIESQEVKDYISNLIDESTKGLKDKNKELLDELKPWKEKLRSDETLKLLSEGKHDEVFRKVREERDVEWQNTIDNNEKKYLTERESLLKYKDQVTDFIYKEEFEKIASKTRLNKSAYKDVLKEIKQEFIINEKNDLLHKESKLNIEGKPLTVENWIEGQIKERSYWFDGVTGSGSVNQQSSLTGSINLTPEKISKLTMKEYKELRKKKLI